jgi:hypothetical protein
VCARHIRECVAMAVLDFMHIPSADNLADVLTKPPGGVTFHRLVRPLLFRRHKLLAYGKEWQAQGSSRCILGEKLLQDIPRTGKKKQLALAATTPETTAMDITMMAPVAIVE